MSKSSLLRKVAIATTLAGGTAASAMGISAMDSDPKPNQMVVKANAPSPEATEKLGNMVTSVILAPESHVTTVTIDNTPTTTTTPAPEAPKPLATTTTTTELPAPAPVAEIETIVLPSYEKTFEDAKTEAAGRIQYLKSGQPLLTTCIVLKNADGTPSSRITPFMGIQRVTDEVTRDPKDFFLVNMRDGTTDEPEVYKTLDEFKKLDGEWFDDAASCTITFHPDSSSYAFDFSQPQPFAASEQPVS